MDFLRRHVGGSEVSREHRVDLFTAGQRANARVLTGAGKIGFLNKGFEARIGGNEFLADNRCSLRLEFVCARCGDCVGHCLEHAPEGAVLGFINDECVELIGNPLDNYACLCALLVSPCLKQRLILR